VEKASIDESFFDLTLEVRRLLLTRYPHLKQAPKTGKGMDEPLPAPPMIEWDDCGELMPIKRLNEEGDPIDREDEGFVPSQEHQLLHPTWTDVALAHGAKLMSKVRKNVFDQLGYTTSAGIASNKTLSKLCSGYRKPNQQTTLLPRAVPAYLRDLPVSSIRFLGGKLGREMGDMWEAKTVGDLWSVPLESMQAHFGPEAAWVHAVLRGVDHAPVSARIANKTMLASKNLRPVIRRRHEALGWLDTLSTELVTRLKELWEDERGAMEESNVQSVFEEELKKESVGASNSPYKASKAPALPTLWPKFLVLRFIRVRDGPRSRQAAFPYVGNLTSEEVYKVAVRLWNEACDEMRIEPSSSLTANTDQQIGGGVEIVTIALGFSGLERAETGQKSIEGFFKAGAAGSGKRKREEDVNDSTKDAKVQDANSRSWTCEECGQTVSVPIQTADTSQAPPAHDSEEFFDNDNPFSGDQTDSWTESSAVDDAQRRLDVRIQDHRDWHFAVKLSNSNDWQDNDSSSTTQQSTHRSNPLTQQATKKPAKKVKKGSLQSFFAKQGPSS
jgi:DNA polymerase eta